MTGIGQMTEIGSVSLAYHLLGFQSLDYVIASGETAGKVRDAEAAVKQYRMKGVFVRVDYANDHSPGNGLLPRPIIAVRISKGSSEAPEDLEGAITQFITTAGHPSYVAVDSDLGLMEKVLGPLGLKLGKPPENSPNNLFKLLPGYYVIPADAHGQIFKQA